MWNITHGDGTARLLGSNVNRDEAVKWLKYYVDTYEGKPMPNGKGNYPFVNFRTIQVS